jgi:hypothetical protein
MTSGVIGIVTIKWDCHLAYVCYPEIKVVFNYWLLRTHRLRIYIRTHTRTHIHIHAHTSAHAHTQHTQAHTHTHTHKHTHPHT